MKKKGLFPNTKWKKNNLGKGWVLGETLITGIGQGYTQTTPLPVSYTHLTLPTILLV